MTILIFLGLAVSFLKDGSAMFSPGELTAQRSANLTLGSFESHAEFENECKQCHNPLQTSQADLCVRCHTNIMQQVADKTGTHAKVEDIQDCRVCHPDHQGRAFNPVAAAFSHFDHTQARFQLIWHQIDYDAAPMECGDCHTTENEFDLKPGTCQDCHAKENPDFVSEHVQVFGKDCIACHDGTGNIANFDHTNTQFPLEGAHIQVECVACHTDGQFESLSTDCLSCHSEPEVHAGLFSQNCETCHTPADWSNLVGMGDNLFDHFEQTQFSLNRHLTNYANQPINCDDCHTSPDGIQVSFDLKFCVDCHTAEDPIFMGEHQTQFGWDCLTCHDGVDRMHNFDHSRFFILDGAHIEAECQSCHLDQVFSGTPSECVDCHIEPEIHAGLFGLQCENCHTTAAWSPAQMVAHTFPLDHGEQGLVDCKTCHVTTYTEYTCYGCHEHDPNRIFSEHAEEGISSAELPNCATCHPDGREHDD